LKKGKDKEKRQIFDFCVNCFQIHQNQNQWHPLASASQRTKNRE